jgi:hypothetical protein
MYLYRAIVNVLDTERQSVLQTVTEKTQTMNAHEICLEMFDKCSISHSENVHNQIFSTSAPNCDLRKFPESAEFVNSILCELPCTDKRCDSGISIDYFITSNIIRMFYTFFTPLKN